MLVEEARKRLNEMKVEDVRELARKEFLCKDVGTLSDMLVTLMGDEQLVEWAIPSIVQGKSIKYGKLGEDAIKRIYENRRVVDGLLFVSMMESISVSNESFIKDGIRLVAEGMEGDAFLMGVYAPAEEEVEEVKPSEELITGPPSEPCDEPKSDEPKKNVCHKCGNQLLLQGEAMSDEELRNKEEIIARELDVASKPTVNMPHPAHTSNLNAPLPMAPKGKSR